MNEDLDPAFVDRLRAASRHDGCTCDPEITGHPVEHIRGATHVHIEHDEDCWLLQVARRIQAAKFN